MKNPWMPGGQMLRNTPHLQGPPDVRSYYGSQFFTPPTDEEIVRQAMLQLAVIAVVVAAPAIIGAVSGSGGAAASSAAASGSGSVAAASAEATTFGLSSSAGAAGSTAASSTVAAGGAGISGATVGAVSGAASGLALSILSDPSLQLGAKQAAGGGVDILDDYFKRSHISHQDSVWGPAETPPFENPAEPTGNGRHPATRMIVNLAESLKAKIGNISAVKRFVGRSKSSMGDRKRLNDLVLNALNEVRFENPWQRSISPTLPQQIQPDCSTEGKSWWFEWFDRVGKNLFERSKAHGFSHQGSLMTAVHAYNERATSTHGRNQGYKSNNWWGLMPIDIRNEKRCSFSTMGFACYESQEEGFEAYFHRIDSPVQIDNFMADDFNPSFPEIGRLFRLDALPTAEELNTGFRIGGIAVFCDGCPQYGANLVSLIPIVQQHFLQYLNFKLKCLYDTLAVDPPYYPSPPDPEKEKEYLYISEQIAHFKQLKNEVTQIYLAD